jgi:hypothetical protein
MSSSRSGGSNAAVNSANGTPSKKGRQPKRLDPEETSKLVQAKYQELEQSKSEEREQAQDIGSC